MTDVVSPPCLHDSRPLPPRNTRVRNGLVAMLAVAVPAAVGLALALAVARRGVAW